MTSDGEGHPLNLKLSPGQVHESRLFKDLWNTTEVSDPKLKHLVQPAAAAGDKAYYSNAIIHQLESERVQPVIPQIGKQIHEQDAPGFDRELYRRRNVVERLISWLKEYRRIATRFEKTAVNFLAMIHVAFIRHYAAEIV